MSASQILGVLLAALAFFCFLVAGLEEGNFATWVDGAGISLLVYGLVRAAGWLINGPHAAEDNFEVPKPSSVQEAAPQGTAPASVQERIERLRERR
jgi:hypothetical protein